MKFKAGWPIAAALLPVLLAAACGGGDAKPKADAYDNDGYLGMTNTNPNLQTGPSYHTYQVDSDMMRNAVASIAGVRNVRVNTNGTNATVRLTVDRGTSDGDKDRIRQEALQALQHAVPRYDYKVTVNGD
ncbi:hypothetical protein [Paenibacillus flagellatus]|uniref:Sporulation protein n=1 Tax=Paenibacillus flagellatus TaxID=2211139 RepID=A0A2V5KF38_9BACL|nr:hypothetical protein [Paenibacillus flagellatus]PYI52690.1 hypothetical protein DLM86_21225 [Paenibacillus flagellatus]